MTARDRDAVKAAMEHPLLLDRGSGVFWDFDFEKEEFRVGTVCNAGLLVDFVVKYDESESLFDQIYDLPKKAREFYDDKEESAGA